MALTGGSRSFRRLIGTGVALVGAMLMAGCAGSAPADPAQSAGSPATRTTSPLDPYLSGPVGGAPSEEEMAAKERQVQDAVVSCMAAEGFEYRPFTYTAPANEQFDAGEYGTRAFAEKYGYGISTNPWGEPTADQSSDPNQPIVDAMSDSEREAYYAVLYGTQVFEATESAAEVAPSEDPGPIPLEEQGCYGLAQQQVYGMDSMTSGEFDELFDELSQLWEKAQSDPAVAEALQRWSTCMSDAGHPGYSTLNAPGEEISSKISELYSAAADPGGAATTDETSAMTAPPPLADDPAFQQLQRDEIALAVADFDCQQQSGHQQVFDSALLSLEEQFVRDNRAELERFRDVTNGGG
jgi:hypothetical protein